MNRRLNEQELEQLIHRTLRSLPNRRAPGTLEARVMAEVERRATIPWWHKSFACWPQGVRVAFLAFCGGLAAVLVLAGIYVQAGFDSAQFHAAVAPAQALADRALTAVRGLADFAALVWRHVPTWWLYGGIAFVAGLYAMLFGLGAAAYRTLWTHR
jgi:hypothetical protein